jgi:hypothetical protein
VIGRVIDFESGQPFTGMASLSTTGLTPPPVVSVKADEFVLEGVPAHSVIYLLAGGMPDGHNTFSPPVGVEAADVTGVAAATLKESSLTAMSMAFGVTPKPGTGMLLVHAVDSQRTPQAGVPANAITVAGGLGPYFLDPNRKPAAASKSTSTSGWLVYFDVAPGVAQIAVPPEGGFTGSPAAAPMAADVVTISELVLSRSTSAPPNPTTPPKRVSLTQDVVPIFTRRGCINCHSGNGPGRDLGGLTLNSSAQVAYRELTQEVSANFKAVRVNLQEPAKSLVLTMPSVEVPADVHPTATFASTADPDYRLILGWIQQGAALN